MTEVPEHLLRRSRERREALGLSTPSATGDAEPSAAVEPAGEAAAAPAPAAPAATPAVPAEPAPPPPPVPVPPHIQAAYARKRIPWWAMPVVAALPLWFFIFALTLEPPSRGADDPLTLGQQIYEGRGACAGCHGAAGQGGVGPQLADGAVLETWPEWQDHVEWVTLGSAGWPESTYGSQGKPVQGGMPGQEGSLTEEEILLVVRYEREMLGGGEPEPDLVAATEGGEGATEGGADGGDGGGEGDEGG